jgi:hypothetical protein
MPPPALSGICRKSAQGAQPVTLGTNSQKYTRATRIRLFSQGFVYKTAAADGANFTMTKVAAATGVRQSVVMSWFKESAAAEKLLMKKKTPRHFCGGAFSVGPLDLGAEHRLYICRLSTTKKYNFPADIKKTVKAGALCRHTIQKQAFPLRNAITPEEYSKI